MGMLVFDPDTSCVRSKVCGLQGPPVGNVDHCYSCMEGSGCFDPHIPDASDDDLQQGAEVDTASNIAEALPLAAWPVIACKLNAFDLIRLSIASCGLKRLLASIPGLWQQACNRHLSWLVQDAAALHEEWSHTMAAAAGTSTGQGVPAAPPQQQQQQQQTAPWKRPTDAAGAAILSAVCRLQQLCRRHRLNLRPMLFTPPPWLSAAPGRTRGLLPMTAGGSQLQPPLLLSPQQAYWLQLGCPIEHVNGVFTTSTAASPHTGTACSAALLLVSHKQLMAELYLKQQQQQQQEQAAVLGPWRSLYWDTGIRGRSSGGGDGSSSSSSTVALPSSASTAAAAAGDGVQGGAGPLAADPVPLELWLRSSLLQQAAPAAGRGGGRTRGTGRGGALLSQGAGHQGPARAAAAAARMPGAPIVATAAAVPADGFNGMAGGSSSSSSSVGLTWPAVHQMLHVCIASNVTRARAMGGTAIVVPGTAAASGVEGCVGALTAAGFPVLDLRHCLEQALHHVHHKQQQQHLRLSSEVCPSRQQEDRRQPRQQCQQGSYDSAAAAAAAAAAGGGGGAAAGEANSAWRQVQQGIIQGMSASLLKHLQEQAAGSSTDAPAAPNNPAADDMEAGMEPCPSSSSSSSSSSSARINSDFLGELLRVVTQRLPRLAPGCQLLVLPLLLPPGQAQGPGSTRNMRSVPGKSSYSSGAAYSGPRLLNLNVPFLMPLRECWEQLPCLVQVVLVVSPGLTAMAAAVGRAEAWDRVQAQHQGQGPQGSHPGDSGAAAGVVPTTVVDAVRSLVASCLDRLSAAGDAGDSWAAGEL